VNATEQTEISRYVEGVRAALADLPPAARDELLEDLPDHLAEVAAEADGTLEERLGPPAAYAAELRTSAGLTGAGGRRGRIDLSAAAIRVRSVAGTLDERVGRAMGYRRASEFSRLLRPGWWVLRGYLVAMLLLGSVVPGPFDLLPAGNEYAVVWFAMVGLAILASVRLGKVSARWRGWPAAGLIAGNALLAVALMVGVADLAQQEQGYLETSSYEDPLRDSTVFPYDRNGQPLRDVRLVDQYGNEVWVGDTYCPVEGPLSEDDAVTYPACGQPPPFPAINPLPTAGPTASPTAPGPTPGPTPSVTPSPSSGG
jgi:hypothetical protein